MGNLIYELLIRRYLIGTGSPYAAYIPLPWGIWAKNLIGTVSGIVALIFFLKKRHYTIGTVILTVFCLAEAVVIVLSMTGSVGRRSNGIIDITMLTMVLLTYTFSQTDRDLKKWKGVQSRPLAVLDLRLIHREDFFDPIQLGPGMTINQDYASVINRYIASMKIPSPLQINLFCAERIPENVRDMMGEVLKMHYEVEESHLEKELEKRYSRIMHLTAVSIFVIGLVRQTSLLTDEMVVWEIIGNFAAFGLWQIGYTHYERNEAYDELLAVHIAKYARLSFIEK